VTMTTETTDWLAALEAAREQRDAAAAEREEIDGEARAWSDGVRQAEAELDHLARTEREQFDEGGQPRAKSRAAQLRKQIAEAREARWPEIIAGADQRLDEAERALRRLTSEHAVELARREYERGLQARQRLFALLRGEEVRDAIAELRAAEQELLAITSAVDGPINGQHVYVDPLLQDFEQMWSASAASSRRGSP
jgi:hypothetical protein